MKIAGRTGIYMFMASFKLNLENEHISVDTALRVYTLQCVTHKIICLI